MNFSIDIPHEDQSKILNYLLDTPPSEYLTDCDTEDRKQHWEACKKFYSCLQAFLKNHFAGTPLPMGEIYIEGLNITVNYSNDTFFQLVGLHMDYYLKLYSVLSWGWRYIDPILELQRTETKNTSIPKTPGEALIQIIDQAFHGLFYVYFPEKVTGNYYDEYSPRKAYNFKKEEDKISRLKEKNPENLSKSEKRKIVEHERKMTKEHKLLKPFIGLEEFFISICLENQKSDATLKRRLTDLKAVTLERQNYITRSQHPRNNRQGYAISKGNMIPATHKGGIYKPS